MTYSKNNTDLRDKYTHTHTDLCRKYTSVPTPYNIYNTNSNRKWNVINIKEKILLLTSNGNILIGEKNGLKNMEYFTLINCTRIAIIDACRGERLENINPMSNWVSLSPSHSDDKFCICPEI